MTSPHPFSTPRRGKRRRKVVYLRATDWQVVYAPRSGRVRQVGEKAVITTGSGWTHTLSGVNVKDRLDGERVTEGQPIGRVTGRRIKYVRRNPDGERRDAMRVCRDPRRWMHGAKRLPARDAGDMSTGGGNERAAVLHTTESNHAPGTVYAVARYTVNRNNAYTGLWNPWTGEFCQTYPGNVAARSLMNAPGLATNRHGKIRQQWSIVGKASEHPLAGGSPLKGWTHLVAFLCSWGIPLKAIDDRDRSQLAWKQSGWHTHASCPGNDHTDPGPVWWKRVLSGAWVRR